MDDRLLKSRYQIISHLGNGGFAQTYLAEDTQLPHRPQYVVKQLLLNSQDPNFLDTARRLFQKEAETLAKLGTHSQIPQLIDYFEEQGEFFLVQEYIIGHSIAREIEQKTWQEGDVIEFIAELLNLLIFVHSHNVIHRDIKPDNLIRRQQDGKLVLIDFGAVKEIAKQTETILGNNNKTTVGIGTVGYMPPEQITGKPYFYSDLYAVGITVIQALTGASIQELNYDLDGEVIWSPHQQVSRELVEFLSKSVRFYVKDRYQTATEALRALQDLFPAGNLISPTTIASESSIPKTIVVGNVITNNFHFLRRKTVLLGVGLAAILASSVTAINVKNWSNRPSILGGSIPSLSTQSTSTTTSEYLPSSITESSPVPKPKSNPNNTSGTISKKTSPSNISSIDNSNRVVKNYNNPPTSSRKVSTQTRKQPTQTIAAKKTTSARKVETPKKTTIGSKKTQEKSQTKRRTQTQKRQPSTRKVDRNERHNRSVVNNRRQREGLSKKRVDRNERRSRSTTNRTRVVNRRNKKNS
jgi:serine/threonine protein kinase